MLVSTDVIRTYQRIILNLDMQVARYKQLLGVLLPTLRETEEPISRPSGPVNAASVALVSSIVNARIQEDMILRAFDDEVI